LIITERKIAHFSVCKGSGFVQQQFRDFVKRTLTRVSCEWLWLESSHFVKTVIRVEPQFFLTWLESSPSHQKSWVESSYWLKLRCLW